MHQDELERLISQLEALQHDVLRLLDEEPRPRQMDGMASLLMDLRRPLSEIKTKLRRLRTDNRLASSGTKRHPWRLAR
jgi:hypothetical protein